MRLVTCGRESIMKQLRYIVTVTLVLLFFNGQSQSESKESGGVSIEGSAAFRLPGNIPLEMAVSVMHTNGYGFQMAVTSGRYTMNELDGTYFDHKNQDNSLSVDYRVSAIAFRPAFLVIQRKGNRAQVNGMGLNYGWSQHQLDVTYTKPVFEKPYTSMDVKRHHLSMELFHQQKYYIKERWVLSFSVMLGVNWGFMLPPQPIIKYEVNETYYRPTQGFTIYDACYADGWIGVGYVINR